VIEENLHKIKQADLVVGIPSYNEANSIGQVVQVADQGLVRYLSNQKAVIINADNHSADDTRAAFLNTPTQTPKIYLSTEKGVKGKGHNIYNIFLKAKALGAKGVMLIDADMKSGQPKWVQCLLEPLLEGYDYISPLYYRDKYDGSITNHLCYPLVYGLLSCDLRQPIGGEVSFSAKMIDYWLAQKWPKSAKLFGIDIMMFFYAIISGYKIGSVALGARIHKPSLPKLDFMFAEVSQTLFQLLKQFQGDWQKDMTLKKPPILCEVQAKKKYPDLSLDLKPLQKKSLAEFASSYNEVKACFDQATQQKLAQIYQQEKTALIDQDLWVSLMYQLLKGYLGGQSLTPVIKLLKALYFGRFSYFIQQCAGLGQDQAEKKIVEQAQQFYQRRHEAFT
jgi:glucosylglycerate synthase